MRRTMDITETLNVVECCNCHMTFAITQRFEKDRRDDHEWFYCPAGHRQHYSGKSEAEKLRDQLAWVNQQKDWADTRATAARDQAETAEYRRRAAVGANTKLKKRIANGICPCCKRSFADLHRHMAGQHPDYAPTPAGGA